MKSWKKRWQEELDAAIPVLSNEVRNEPIPARDRTQTLTFTPVSEPWYKQLIKTPRRIASCVAACVVCVAAVGASAYLFRPGVHMSVEQEVISVEVNPQAVFAVNKEGIVTAVNAVNQDADVVLADERYMDMQGKTVQEAVEIFVDYTAKLGYLDLNTQEDVVRVTSCVQNGRLNEVADALQNYFMDKGAYVAVAKETIEIDAFCQRVKMKVCDSVQMLKSSVERIPALTFLREAEGKTGAELQEVYKKNVPFEEVKNIFCSTLNNVEKRVNDFLDISELADDIYTHEDNKFGLLGLGRDYWNIPEDEVPESMSAMMTEMSEKLLAYEQNYGVKIDGLDALVAEGVRSSRSVLSTVTSVLKEALLSTSVELLSKKLQAVSTLLKSFDIDTTLMEDLLELPETLESYSQKVNKYMQECFNSLKKEAQTGYETVREKISSDAYADFVARLESEHGSLSEYFKESSAFVV